VRARGELSPVKRQKEAALWFSPRAGTCGDAAGFKDREKSQIFPERHGRALSRHRARAVIAERPVG